MPVQELITTDGTTLLGADDKAGLAEIVTAMEYLIQPSGDQAWQDPPGIYP